MTADDPRFRIPRPRPPFTGSGVKPPPVKQQPAPVLDEPSYAEGIFQGGGAVMFAWGLNDGLTRAIVAGAALLLLSIAVAVRKRWRRERDSNPRDTSV